MAKLLSFMLACYATWFVFAQAELPLWHRAREWLSLKSQTFGHFIMCPMCSGFWCSLLVAVGFNWPVSSTVPDVVSILMQALTGAASVFLVETHVTRLERR